jgi:hypothetical protein
MPRIFNPFTSWIIIVFLILSSTRGALIIHFDFSYEIVYTVVNVALMLIALIGVFYSSLYREKNLAILKFALVINLLMFLFHIAFIFAFFDLDLNELKSYVLLFSAPYVIFTVLLLKEKHIESILIMVTLLLAYSIIYNFIEMIGTNGGQHLLEYRTKLRGRDIGMSNSGDLYGITIQRIGGYTGSMHDSGNILGMLSVFFFISYFVKKNNYNLWLFILSFIALLMTQSLANLMVAIFTMIVFYSFLINRTYKLKIILFGLILYVLLFASIIYYEEYIQKYINLIFARLFDESSRSGMVRKLGLEDLIFSIPIALSGHGKGLNSEHMIVEIALMKMIYELNIFHATIYFFILLFPLVLFVKYYKFTKKLIILYPPLAANVFGFLSLLHYGSLVRSTSIFVYFAISALFIKHFLQHRFLFFSR